MRKKWLVACSCILLAAAALVGCKKDEPSAEKKDGTYRAEMKEASHGWKDFVEVTVRNGKIETVVYDALNDEGQKKSQDEDYKKSMIEGNKNADKPETYPADYAKKLADALIEKQEFAETDAVAGATNSSKDFKTLVDALKENMKKGKTETVIVDNSKK